MSKNHSGDQTRHVFLCADANFVVPLAVTLRSLAETQDNACLLSITVLSAGIPQSDQDRIQASVPELSLRFVSIEQYLPSDIPNISHLNRSTYGRLFGVDLLPSGAKRAVYLDADVIVTTDIGFLFSFDLKGAPVAAVQSPTIPHVSNPMGLAQWRSIGISPRTRYMNTGVLVIDVDAWKTRNIGRAVLDFVRNNLEFLSLADQDGLNGVLAGDWAELPLRWNQESCLRRNTHFAYSFFPRDEVDEAINDPAIVHFTGPKKPWRRGCSDAAAPKWLDLLERTVYELPQTPNRLRSRIVSVGRRLLRV
jgi:lipopolysaccharide biosynthesis glycosyltransferase